MMLSFDPVGTGLQLFDPALDIGARGWVEGHNCQLIDLVRGIFLVTPTVQIVWRNGQAHRLGPVFGLN
jgi:hypothetical protein